MESEIFSSSEKMSMDTYSTLFLGENEFAINVREIQEVVNYPGYLAQMPLAPDYLVGFFNLNNVVIPLVDICHILNLKSSSDYRNKKVAIINNNDGAKIGLLFDRTGEVLRFDKDLRNEFNYAEDSAAKVIGGTIQISETRLLLVINRDELFKLENVPLIRGQKKNCGINIKDQKMNFCGKKCIGFSVGNERIAIELDKTHEVIQIRDVKIHDLESEIYLGYIHLKNLIVPLVNFATIIESKTNESPSEDRKAIIIKLAEEFIGFVVDSVDTISTFTDDQISSLPMMNKNRFSMFVGCLFIENKEFFLIDSNKVLTNNELLELTQGHLNLY